MDGNGKCSFSGHLSKLILVKSLKFPYKTKWNKKILRKSVKTGSRVTCLLLGSSSAIDFVCDVSPSMLVSSICEMGGKGKG